MRTFGGTRPYLIGCGPSSNDPSWTHGFFSKLYERQRRVRIDGYAMHFYSRGGNPSTKFTMENVQEQLSSFADLEKAILQQRAIMDGFDPDRRIGLLIDEWGVWDRMVPEEEEKFGRLWQQNTIRSAVAAAMGLNVFHRQAEKLDMCNIAQTVNVLQALLLTYKEQCVVTPTYYAYELAKPHRDGTSLHTDTGDDSPLGLSVSASRQGNQLAVTLINPQHDTTMNVAAEIQGATVSGGTARILHHADWNACNTFDSPNVVTPSDHSIAASGSKVTVELPPLSIVTAILRISS
jgi:alpha-N-arabinofuranosidase